MMYLARIRFARIRRLSAHETMETAKDDHAEGRRVWGRQTTPEMMRLFSEAEQRKTCLVPPSPRVRETLRRHVKQGKAVHPARGMYARASYWRSLSKPQQALWILRATQALHRPGRFAMNRPPSRLGCRFRTRS